MDRGRTARDGSVAESGGGTDSCLHGRSPRSSTKSPHSQGSPKRLQVAGLFAGIGGLELGLQKAGHEAVLLCELMDEGRAVLEERFPGVKLQSDVRTLEKLQKGTDLVTAGFPCQDLSQAGRTRGITGENSGLVDEVFRLLERQRLPWILLENVPFMMQLRRGEALDHVLSRLEALGYNWAYRVIDARAFGRPQRRLRWYLVASRSEDPREVLLSQDAGEPLAPSYADWAGRIACGFYWTEGNRGLGWAYDAVPTLKGGSGLGIPSPPAIIDLERRILKPDIRDAERLQGFHEDWTKPAEKVSRSSMRWKLVGNAVSVDVAEWLGRQLAVPNSYDDSQDIPLEANRPWPKAAWYMGGKRHASSASAFPEHRTQECLADFLRFSTGSYLSVKATEGFLGRLEKSTLRAPDPFKQILRDHIAMMLSQEENKSRRARNRTSKHNG